MATVSKHYYNGSLGQSSTTGSSKQRTHKKYSHGLRVLKFEISKVLSTITGRLIVIGDLNTTMWTKGYTKFVKSNNLLNASKGNGIIPTWGKYLKSLLSIPIDHCFTRGDFDVHSLYAVEISGSNHDGLVLEVHER